MTENRDVVVIGGGHNGLVAAGYLARAGLDVVVLEARDVLGGAVASSRVCEGVDASLSRFSYLVSLLPQQVVDDLGLEIELRSRPVASYTPVGDSGLLVERVEGEPTKASFRALTGDDAEYGRWRAFHERLGSLARVLAPTLTRPLPRASDVRAALGDEELWRGMVERPLGHLVEDSFSSDTVRGVVMTDGLIGMNVSPFEESLAQNRCFLYHVIGGGTGEWRVPVGGMGRVASALETSARAAGADLRVKAAVVRLTPTRGGGGTVTLADGTKIRSRYVLGNCAPLTLRALYGRGSLPLWGNQLKINMVVRRLPRLASGIDPRVGFAGTVHLGQGFRRLTAVGGSLDIADPMPCEVYCHTLTDPSILSPALGEAGFHTLTLFGLSAPMARCLVDPKGSRRRAGEAALRALDDALAEPLLDCLARDAYGQPCLEVMTPVDIENELGMPGGHIFHGDLSWPWLADDAPAETAAEQWGVATEHPGILLCGSGAVRGGAVSGIGGHNAAMAVLADAG